MNVNICRLRFLLGLPFLCLPAHPHPLCALYLLTVQAYLALFIFRISKCWNKTFLLFPRAHDGGNQHHDDSYGHDDLDGFAANNSKEQQPRRVLCLDEWGGWMQARPADLSPGLGVGTGVGRWGVDLCENSSFQPLL